ncbi:probable polygalacturonase At1g80170 [Daucus carota subsp. sativus]|uniref:probable polygalacturonase At1g80170 n=1 Tax=Daucus carota subsp. sativus TaxID=79200 RepID=UPI0007EF0007|nr:PREDICTED: probable polygalacturonase At1g80170 [Daucus carota subsp. sativus]
MCVIDVIEDNMLQTKVCKYTFYNLSCSIVKIMELVAWFLITGLISFHITYSDAQPADVNVIENGANGDGKTDSTRAFNKAWDVACGITGASAKLVVPQGRFLVKQTTFKGPCKAAKIIVELGGTIVAPDTPKAWDGLDAGVWLVFEAVNGMTLDGLGNKGGFNGNGKGWWDQSCRYHPDLKGCTKLAPTSLKFFKSNNLRIKGVNIVQSPQTHVLLFKTDRVTIDSVNIDSPKDSPNTDGIHIQSANGVSISNCKIKNGDDNISIGDHCLNIKINNIECGPGGHGISIGSLGKDGGQVEVRNIHVKNVSFTDTTNGARIKTWQVGKGVVQNVIYEDIKLEACEAPIVIDQNYCAVRGACKEKAGSGVQISDVVFKNFHGTAALAETIQMGCSKSFPCKGITLDAIDLSPAKGVPCKAICTDAHGTEKGTVKPGPCLLAQANEL